METTRLTKLSMLETLRGTEVCGICGVKYQWAPGADCPNHCKMKIGEEEGQQQRLAATEAERQALQKKLEAIGYSGKELEGKIREIQAQIVAASFLPSPAVPIPVSAATIAKGVLLANLIVGAVVFLLALFIKSLSL